MLVIGDLTFVTPVRRHDPDVTRHARIRMVIDDTLAVGMPHVHPPGLTRRVRSAVDSAAPGELLSGTPFRGDSENMVLVVQVLGEREPASIRRPSWLAVLDVFGQEHPLFARGQVDDSQVVPPVPVRDERQLRPVRRPLWLHVPEADRVGSQKPSLPSARWHDVDV